MRIPLSKRAYFVALLLAGFACAEPIGVDVPNKGKGTGTKAVTSSTGGTTPKATEDTSSSGGSTDSTPQGDGGAKAASTKATDSTKGGSTGIVRTTAPKATGGTESTAATEPTSSGGSGEETTTAPAVTGSCATSTEQVKVVATWNKSGSSGSTTITPAAGATVAAADMGVKFCFTISSKLTPGALVIPYGAISLKRDPYNVVLTNATITVEDNPEGGSCMVIDVGGVAAAKDITLDGETKMQLDWRFEHSVVGESQPDPTKPAQFIVTVGSDVAGCGDVPLT